MIDSMKKEAEDYEKQIYDLKQLLEISKSLSSSLEYNVIMDSILYICMAQMRVLSAGLFSISRMGHDFFSLHRNYKGFELDHNIDYIIPKNSPFIEYIQTNNKCYTIDELKQIKELQEDKKTLHMLEIDPAECDMYAGEHKFFSVKGYDAYSNELPDEKVTPTWTASGGTISNTGEFIAETVGSWQVSASFFGKTATADVNIIAGEINYIEIAPDTHSMYVSDQKKFEVSAFDEYDNEVTEEFDVIFSTSGGGTINTEGVFTANVIGSWEVIATVTEGTEDIKASSSVTVRPKGDTDSDGDGLPDVWEQQYNLDPNDPGDAHMDSDSDSADNLLEYTAGTNPTDKDTDGDSLPDGWELDFELDPMDPFGENGNIGDPDGDGYSNIAEYSMGTNPKDAKDPKPVEQEGDTDDSKISASDKADESTNMVPFILIIAVIIGIMIVLSIVLRARKKPPVKPEVAQPQPEVQREYTNSEQLPATGADQRSRLPPQWNY